MGACKAASTTQVASAGREVTAFEAGRKMGIRKELFCPAPVAQPVILPTWEAEIKRIRLQGQPRQTV
jgi:hypothetical protein